MLWRLVSISQATDTNIFILLAFSSFQILLVSYYLSITSALSPHYLKCLSLLLPEDTSLGCHSSHLSLPSI